MKAAGGAIQPGRWQSARRHKRFVLAASSAKVDSVGAGNGSFPKNAADVGFDRVAERCSALIDGSCKRGTPAACAVAIAAILDNAAAITERPAWTLGEAELLAFGKRLTKLPFRSYLDRLRDVLTRREWGDAYYVALAALREAKLA
jgi:hypothetical protein